MHYFVFIAEEMDYDKFFDAVKSLFGPDVKAQDVKTFYRKISNNPDGRTEWCEVRVSFLLINRLFLTINIIPDQSAKIWKARKNREQGRERHGWHSKS